MNRAGCQKQIGYGKNLRGPTRNNRLEGPHRRHEEAKHEDMTHKESESGNAMHEEATCEEAIEEEGHISF